MLEILKEMGIVCTNKKIAEKLKEFHLQQYFHFYWLNKKEAKDHEEQFLFWSEKVLTMNKHILQLHHKIKNNQQHQ